MDYSNGPNDRMILMFTREGRLQQKLELLTFAVVVRKDVIEAKHIPCKPKRCGMGNLFQRLERFTTMGKTHVWVPTTREKAS
jgi:hypothetical protein